MAYASAAFNIARRITSGPSWTPFRGGLEYSDAAAVAKLTGAIMTGARRRHEYAQYNADLERERHYRDIQTAILEQKLRQPPKPTYEMDIPAPGALTGGEIGPQPEHPVAHITGLTPEGYAGHIQAQNAQSALADERAAARDLAERRFALAQEALASLKSARAKRGAGSPGVKAKRQLAEIDAEQAREERTMGDRITAVVNQALADLKLRPEQRHGRVYAFVGDEKRVSPEQFTGLRWDGNAYVDANGTPLSQVALNQVRQAMVARAMTHNRPLLEERYGPTRRKYQGMIEQEADEAAGAESEREAFLKAFSAGP